MSVLRLAQKDRAGEADLWPVQTPLAAPGFLQLLHRILALPLDSKQAVRVEYLIHHLPLVEKETIFYSKYTS